MNSKQTPQDCDTELCCKATGSLNEEVVEELKQEDKALASLLEKKEQESNEDQDNS